jgi:hypothetical protein
MYDDRTRLMEARQCPCPMAAMINHRQVAAGRPSGRPNSAAQTARHAAHHELSSIRCRRLPSVVTGLRLLWVHQAFEGPGAGGVTPVDPLRPAAGMGRPGLVETVGFGTLPSFSNRAPGGEIGSRWACSPKDRTSCNSHESVVDADFPCWPQRLRRKPRAAS